MWRRLLCTCLLGCALWASPSWSQGSPSQPPSSSALPTLSDAEVRALLEEADSTIARDEASISKLSTTVDKLSLRLELSDKVQKQLESTCKTLLIGFGLLLVIDAVKSTADLIEATKK
jgi:hypothetical protein